MRPTMRPTNMFFAVAASAVLLGSACTDADNPLIILHNQVPDEGCIVPVNETGGFFSRGLIDTQAASGYIFTPLVQNNALPIDGNPNARIASVQGATVKISLQEGTGIDLTSDAVAPLVNFTKRFSGTIQPDGGLGTFAFTIIDKALLTVLEGALGSPDQRLEVQAEVRIFGQMGGGDVDAVPFLYVVEVCNGCMQVDVGACSDLATDFVAKSGGECNVLQDVVLECCTELDNSLTCPAVPNVADPV